MGVDPAKWGPAAWRLLHHLTFRYPADPPFRTLHAYRKVFGSLPTLLPCGACRRHLRSAYRKSPPRLGKGRDRLVRWFYNVHVHVNRQLRKRVVRPRLEREVPGIERHWKAGVPTLMLAVVLGMPTRKVSEAVRDFVTGCRALLGPRVVPDATDIRTKSRLLAEVRRFYGLSHKKVLARFGRWTSRSSLYAIGGRDRPSGRRAGRGSSSSGTGRRSGR